MGYVDKLLAEGERIHVRTRQHRFVLLRAIGVALLVIALGIVAAIYLRVDGPPTARDASSGLLLTGALLFALLAALPGWLRWANEEYIVTDRRVIQAKGVFSKSVLDSSLDKVNDVRLTQTLAGRVFGYGTLEILTASDSAINVLDWIPDPLRFKRSLLEAKGWRVLDRPTESMDAAPALSVAERISQLEDLRRRGLVTQQEYEAKRADLLARL